MELLTDEKICTNCSKKCCKGAEDIILNSADVKKIPENLRTALKDRTPVMLKENNACKALDGNGCSIYSSRPMQCRMFPIKPAAYVDKKGFMWEVEDCALSKKFEGKDFSDMIFGFEIELDKDKVLSERLKNTVKRLTE